MIKTFPKGVGGMLDFLGDFLAGVIEVLFVDRWVEKQYDRRKSRKARAARSARCPSLRCGKKGEMRR